MDMKGDKKVKDVIYFIDTELQKRRKELAELDRDSYLKFLEHDYAQRSQAAFGDEKGFFGIGALKPYEAIDDNSSA